MRKLFIGGLIGLSLTMMFAFATTYQPKENTAEVEQMEGLYIFTDSKPVMDYEYLGTLKASIGFSSQYQSVRNKLVKKAKKKYPEAEAVIFHFKAGGTDRCDAIKYKH